MRIHFAYWGRRGGGARLALDVARAALHHPGLTPTFSIASSNVLRAEYQDMARNRGKDALLVVDTFETSAGALTTPWRLPRLRRALIARLRADCTEVLVTIMPHVWGPLVAPAVRRAGITYATIVHDARAHPGDRTGLVHGWLMRDAERADLVLTLSRAVTSRLASRRSLSGKPLATLFTPDMPPWRTHGDNAAGHPPAIEERASPCDRTRPFRLAFVGRILPYKGLPLLVEAVRLARERGFGVELGVFGEGPLGAEADALGGLGACIANHWLSDAELAAVLAGHDAVILAHTEASQSGVVALATGHGLPVIATPVGALVEQVSDGVTGVLAAAPTAPALADAICRLAGDTALHARIRTTLASTRNERSCHRFLDDLCIVLRQQLKR